MREEEFDYILDFISDMMNDESITRILKHNYAFSFTKEDFDKLDLGENVKTYYKDYHTSSILTAYDPFLDIIKDMIVSEGININDVLDKVDAYSLNRRLFVTYITDPVCKPTEPALLAEIEYNTERLINDIVNILCYISSIKPLFIMLNNVNQICDSSLKLIQAFINLKLPTLKIFIITNAMAPVRDYLGDSYDDLIEDSSYLGIVYEWPLSGDAMDAGELDATNYNFKNTEEELDCIETMFNTYCYSQANYYLSHIYQKIEFEKVLVLDEYKFRLILLYMKTSIFLENYTFALILCERLKNVRCDISIDEKNYIYEFYMGFTNTYIGNEIKAMQHSKRCYENAVKTGNEFNIFKSLILLNMAEMSGWKDFWFSDRNHDVPDTLIKLCYKYKYYNHLSHIYVYNFDNKKEQYISPDNIEEKIPTVMKGIKIANELGNDKFLFEAYRKNIMIASVNGLFETSNYFHLKTIEIVKKNKNKTEEANIYNGLGYNNVTVGKYEDANIFYNKALKIFCEERSGDYICETLYNMGTNALMAGDFGNAANYLTIVVQIIHNMKKSRLRVCNNSKIYGLLAISSFKQGNYFTAQVYVKKCEYFLMYVKKYLDDDEYFGHQWDDDFVMFYIASALIEMKNEDYDKALQYFKESEFYINRSQGSRFINYALYSADLAELYKITGEDIKRERLLKEAYKYYININNVSRANLYKTMLETGKCEYPYLNIGLDGVTMDEILNYIKIESITHEVHIKDMQIDFFGTFQELTTNTYSSAKEELTTLITNFKNNFRLDNILYISYEKGKPEIKYNDIEYNVSKKDIEFIAKYFHNNTSGFAVSQFSDTFYDYEKIIRIFEASHLFSIMAAPIYRNDVLYSYCIALVKINTAWSSANYRETLDKKDLNIFKLFFRLLIDASEKYALNDRLMKQAVTDELTGLLNRQGYYKNMEKKLNEAITNKKSFSCAFLYIDLDHFKFYNDTFGHHVGDAILIRFAEIFYIVSKGKGFAVRFGGDEFVIILNTSKEPHVKRIIQRIYEYIEKEDGFTHIVEEYLNKKIDIPKSSRATCSIGYDIKKNITSATDITDMEKNADKALYYIKENGRGKAINFETLNLGKNEML